MNSRKVTTSHAAFVVVVVEVVVVVVGDVVVVVLAIQLVVVLVRNWIIAIAIERVASSQTAHREPAAFEGAMLFQGFQSIG